jgi:hypothetical protein
VAAKKVFRQWMLLTGHLDEFDLPDHLRYFVDAVKEEELFLKGEFDDAKQEVEEELRMLKAQIKNIERALQKECDTSRRLALQLDLEIAVGENEELLEHVEERRATYLAFKEDKRLFLIEYINRQTQPSP